MRALTLLYSPFPSLEAARQSARALLEARVVACCNLLPQAESHYWWEGRLEAASEVVLIAKTTADQVEKARALLTASHPYACPAILSFSAEANAPYAAWATTQIAPGTSF